MGTVEVREPVWAATFPGERAHIPQVRREAREQLRPYLADPDDVLLCLSEVTTNTLEHTASGRGGKFGVRMLVGPADVLFEVTDDGGTEHSPGIPAEPEATRGRGLLLVTALAESWGHREEERGRTVWFAFPRT